jgi:F plasmid transfer operon, TraF, protein
MSTRAGIRPFLSVILLPGLLTVFPANPTRAQTVERLGVRALGMGGAFVGVADDASAVYWNPAGLATGATVSLVVETAREDTVNDKNAPVETAVPALRGGSRLVASSAPSFGVAFYRLESRELAAVADPTSDEIRETLARLAVNHYTATLVQTLLEGVVVGGTLKLLRGTASAGQAPVTGSVDDALESADDLPTRTTTEFDVDVGIMVNAGIVRVGLMGRNLTEPEFELPLSTEPPLGLQRHARLGVAVTPGRGAYAPGATTILSADLDLTRLQTHRGEQRDFAAGAEHWLFGRRIGVRGGLRLNTLDSEQRAFAGGVSVALRQGSYIDSHYTRGRTSDDFGWGVAARLTF